MQGLGRVEFATARVGVDLFYRICDGILLCSKSVSGPKGGHLRSPNHAGFSFRYRLAATCRF